MVQLGDGERFCTHQGFVEHDEILGKMEGHRIKSSAGSSFVALRPTLADVILCMPRGAQVIYPKDIACMMMVADIFPGAKVVEAGVGSAALSMALLQAGADVVGYELRSDFAKIAMQNVVKFLGDDVPYYIKQQDAYLGFSEKNLDRILLDLPEPEKVIPHAQNALLSGGILVSYLPGINQVERLTKALVNNNFCCVKTIEVLQRSWHIEKNSVRPDHRMVAHTGFITWGRLLKS